MTQQMFQAYSGKETPLHTEISFQDTRASSKETSFHIKGEQTKKWLKEREKKDNHTKMPLTKKGRKILKEFEKEYEKKKGEGIFYAWERKHKGIKK